MNRLALYVAVGGCFAMAGVGLACGVTPLVCTIRAGLGGVALYVAARVAGRLAAHILAGAVLQDAAGASKRKGETGDVRS